ncbi:MAG TPA: hypothetical protein VJI97_03905 [Candidatus Nanoarchaeia archaeon]|nr:hypothetical protein [Candidatus Nanoarchaeia archaeon]
MNKQKELLELRKGYIDKICSWDTKVFYGFMLFFGGIFFLIINSMETLKGFFHLSAGWIISGYIVITVLFLGYLEYTTWNRIKTLYSELANDLKKNELQNFNKLGVSDWLKGKA